MGVFFPAGIPDAIRAKLHGEFVRVLQIPEARDRIVALGNEVVSGSAEDLGAMLDRELKLYAKIIKSAGIRPQ